MKLGWKIKLAYAVQCNLDVMIKVGITALNILSTYI